MHAALVYDESVNPLLLETPYDLHVLFHGFALSVIDPLLREEQRIVFKLDEEGLDFYVLLAALREIIFHCAVSDVLLLFLLQVLFLRQVVELSLLGLLLEKFVQG